MDALMRLPFSFMMAIGWRENQGLLAVCGASRGGWHVRRTGCSLRGRWLVMRLANAPDIMTGFYKELILSLLQNYQGCQLILIIVRLCAYYPCILRYFCLEHCKPLRTCFDSLYTYPNPVDDLTSTNTRLPCLDIARHHRYSHNATFIYRCGL